MVYFYVVYLCIDSVSDFIGAGGDLVILVLVTASRVQYAESCTC